MKREPLPSSLVDLDAAFVQVDRHLDQIEADAGPDDSGDVAAAVIALEQPIEVAGRDANAAIGDGDDRLDRASIAASTAMVPPFGEYLTAFDKRLLKTWSSSLASPTIGIGDAPNRSAISRARHHLAVQLADFPQQSRQIHLGGIKI